MMKRLPVFLQSGWILALFFSPLVTANPRETIQATIENESFDELLRQDQVLKDATELQTAAAALWNKYRKAVTADGERIQEQATKQIRLGDKTMKFSLTKKGVMPEKGYPLYIALHGGGGTAASVNDSQWEHMKVYYADSVNSGIYVATRGVTNTWNLHFVDESYPLYDHLIENLVAFENVDPNRVYILGFSAGGDGVYHITPRMADRWAAANMSAGHHNWITFDNLYNTPFLIQMGEYDSAYDRNKVAVENSMTLDRLQAQRGGYVHEVFLHSGGSHNSWRDNDASRREQTIISNPEKWLKGEPATTTRRNTNAIDWLNQYARNPYPPTLHWDPKTGAPRSHKLGARYLTDAALKASLSEPRQLFYWLDLKAQDAQGSGVLSASFDKAKNSVQLNPSAPVTGLRVLLHTNMVDFNRPISLSIGSQSLGEVLVQPNVRTMTRTMLERGDLQYMFQGEIEVKKQADGQWILSAAFHDE